MGTGKTHSQWLPTDQANRRSYLCRYANIAYASDINGAPR